MKIYLLQYLEDGCAYITEKVCLTVKISKRELIKFQKINPRKTLRIEIAEVIRR